MTLTDAFDIRPDDLSHPDVANLLRYHLANMAAWSPEESCHALDLDGLRGADIDFYCAWRDSELAGCGALKRHADGLGEIKSMITRAGLYPPGRRGAYADAPDRPGAAPRFDASQSGDGFAARIRAGPTAVRTVRLRLLRTLRGLPAGPVQRVHDPGFITT